MLDTSISTTNVMDLIMGGAEQFLVRIRPADQAKVGWFSDNVGIMRDFTSDPGALIRSLGDVRFGNDTRLFDAIAHSVDSLLDVNIRRWCL